MATIRKRKLRNGQIVYDIQVYVNGKLKCKSWRQSPTITDKRQAEREVERFANNFEFQERNKLTDFKDKTTFKEFANEWLEDFKRKNSLTSYCRNKRIIQDVNRFIGDKPLTQIQPIHIKSILNYLNDKKVITKTAIIRKPLDDIIKDKKIRQISKDCGFSFTTFLFARKGCPIQWQNAERLAKTLNINIKEYFDVIKNERPYSKGSKDIYKRVINAILNKAVMLELIPNNPAKKVFTKGAISGYDKEKEILTLSETEQFENALLNIHEDNKLREKAAIGLLFYCAMRLGEVAGLEWKDIDFQKHIISIQRSTIYVGSQFGTITKEPKSKTSIRKVPIPTKLYDILQEYQVWYNNERQKLGDVWQDTDRVIPRWNGAIITPSTIRLWLDKLLAENGIRRVSPHSLRHTNITIQLRNGIPPKAVAKIVGHSDPSVTINVYSHYLEEDEQDYVALFDNLFKKKA